MALFGKSAKSGNALHGELQKFSKGTGAITEKTSQYWQGLSERERLLISAGIIFLLGLLCFLYVVEPLKKTLNTRVGAVEEIQNDVLWMEQQLPVIEQLKSRNPTLFLKDQRPLAALVEQTLADFGLRDSTQRIVPEQNTIQVWMQQAPFEDVLRWIDSLGKYGVSVKRFDVTPHEDGLGNVDLSLDLEK